MRYKVGDKVKCILPAFESAFGKDNIWIIDTIRTQAEPYPSLYLCHRETDKSKTLFHFPESEVEKV